MDPFQGTRTLSSVEVRGDVPAEDLDATVDSLVDVNGTAIAPGRVQAGASGSVDGPVPGSGGEGPPTDPDGDGVYEDGEADLLDAVALAFVDASRLTPDQTAALDVDGDGDVDSDDALQLAFSV